jgi:lysozyme
VQQDTTVTKIEAEHYLEKGLASFAAKIRPHIAAPINDNEFGAFVSLAYNIGPAAFIKSSALRHFNEGDKAKAAAAIKLWNKARVDGTLRVMNGLINRREDEVRLFQTPPTLAPSPTVADRPNSLVAVLVLLLQRILSALLKRGSK